MVSELVSLVLRRIFLISSAQPVCQEECSQVEYCTSCPGPVGPPRPPGPPAPPPSGSFIISPPAPPSSLLEAEVIEVWSQRTRYVQTVQYYMVFSEKMFGMFTAQCWTVKHTSANYSHLLNTWEPFWNKEYFWIYPPRKCCFIFSSKYCKIWSAAQCSVSTLPHHWTAEPSFYHQLFRGKIYSECKALNSERIRELFRD